MNNFTLFVFCVFIFLCIFVIFFFISEFSKTSRIKNLRAPKSSDFDGKPFLNKNNNFSILDIENERNQELRYQMIQSYGQERFIEDSIAKKLHSDDFGTLYEKKLGNNKPILIIKVINSTEEPDGSFKDYFLFVHPELKPLPSPNLSPDQQLAWLYKQNGQILTARNAVASTFGLRGEDYLPVTQT